MVAALHLKVGCRWFRPGRAQVIACLAVARSGNLLATGQRSAVGLSADIAIWDLATGALLHRCCLHKVR